MLYDVATLYPPNFNVEIMSCACWDGCVCFMWLSGRMWLSGKWLYVVKWLYINERSIYIRKYLTYPNDAVFTYLLSSNCHSVVKSVATYIYHANHRRTEYNPVNM